MNEQLNNEPKKPFRIAPNELQDCDESRIHFDSTQTKIVLPKEPLAGKKEEISSPRKNWIKKEAPVKEHCMRSPEKSDEGGEATGNYQVVIKSRYKSRTATVTGPNSKPYFESSCRQTPAPNSNVCSSGTSEQKINQVLPINDKNNLAAKTCKIGVDSNKHDAAKTSHTRTKPAFLLQLEHFLSTELHSLQCSNGPPNATRIQVFGKCFDMFIEEFRTYQRLLRGIKNEYDTLIEIYSHEIQKIAPLEADRNTLLDRSMQEISLLRFQHEANITELKADLNYANSQLLTYTSKNAQLADQKLEDDIRIEKLQINYGDVVKSNEALILAMKKHQMDSHRYEIELDDKSSQIQALKNEVSLYQSEIQSLKKHVLYLEEKNFGVIFPEESADKIPSLESLAKELKDIKALNASLELEKETLNQTITSMAKRGEGESSSISNSSSGISNSSSSSSSSSIHNCSSRNGSSRRRRRQDDTPCEKEKDDSQQQQRQEPLDHLLSLSAAEETCSGSFGSTSSSLNGHRWQKQIAILKSELARPWWQYLFNKYGLRLELNIHAQDEIHSVEEITDLFRSTVDLLIEKVSNTSPSQPQSNSTKVLDQGNAIHHDHQFKDKVPHEENDSSHKLPGDYFEGLGVHNEQALLFLRFNGRVRNIRLPKRDTERLINDCWAQKEIHEKATGQKLTMEEFFYRYLKMKYTSDAAIAEWGFNTLAALEQYSYDSDCRLFLGILRGEIAERVREDQLKMLKRMYEYLLNYDKLSNSGRATGFLSMSDFMRQIRVLFPLKLEKDFLKLQKALLLDSRGTSLDYGSLLAEDHEGNQGKFCECLRGQHLNEILEFSKDIQEAIHAKQKEKGDIEDNMIFVCDIIQAIQSCDPSKPLEEVYEYISRGSNLSLEEIEANDMICVSVPMFLRRLQSGLLKRSGPRTSLR